MLLVLILLDLLDLFKTLMAFWEEQDDSIFEPTTSLFLLIRTPFFCTVLHLVITLNKEEERLA